MKDHIGVDMDSGLAHAVRAHQPTSMMSFKPTPMLHGKEVDGYGNAGCQGTDKRPDMPKPEAERKFQWHVAMKHSQRKALDHQLPISAIQEQFEQVTSKIRAKVEHAFRDIKRQFGHVKVR